MALSPSVSRPTPATNTAPVVARPLDMRPIVEHPRIGIEHVRQSGKAGCSYVRIDRSLELSGDGAVAVLPCRFEPSRTCVVSVALAA
jgi:hypothetical protein